jgi:hypothetical protein
MESHENDPDNMLATIAVCTMMRAVDRHVICTSERILPWTPVVATVYSAETFRTASLCWMGSREKVHIFRFLDVVGLHRPGLPAGCQALQ